MVQVGWVIDSIVGIVGTEFTERIATLDISLLLLAQFVIEQRY